MSLQSELLMPQYDYHIKDLFNVFLKLGLYDKLRVKVISDNVFFKEKETDILAIGTHEDIPELIEQGYKETEYENYINTFSNAITHISEVTSYKLQEFSRVITINGIEIGIGFKDKVVNITQQNPYKLIKSIEYDFKVDDFIIDENGFVYILAGDTFIKSHIAMSFYKPDDTHDCITSIPDIENLYSIKLPNIKQLLSIDDYEIFYLDKSNKVINGKLGRKYYFIKDSQVFFNVIGNTDKTTIQVEHTHFYDWISLLGLNNFTIEDKKLSTKYTDKFMDIIKFPFNSTLNGMLNYSDFLETKDYKINKDIDFIKIEGNFNHEYKKGNFEIVLRANKTKDQSNVDVHADLIYNKECLKSVYGNTVNGIFYFCNLKFIFYKETYSTLIRIPIEIKDDYSVKVVQKYNYLDEKSLINDFDDLAKIDQFFRRNSNKHQLIETDVENGFFIIRNYIKNANERNFQKDFAVRLIEPDGSPSMLWRQIKNKDYFLKLKNYLVVKKLKPRRTEKPLLSCSTVGFSLNLKDYIK